MWAMPGSGGGEKPVVAQVSTAGVSRWCSAKVWLTSFTINSRPPAYAGGTDLFVPYFAGRNFNDTELMQYLRPVG